MSLSFDVLLLPILQGIKSKDTTYKLSTNGVLDEEYDNLGWTISQYDDTTGDSRDVQLNPSSKDVVMELKDGQVLSTSYDNTSDTVNADSVKLIFTTQKQCVKSTFFRYTSISII